MFNTIVWATDGSPAADAALPEVRKLAGSNGSALVVVHCDERMAGGRSYGEPLYADEPDMMEKIAGQVKDLAREGVHVTEKVVPGYSGAAVAAHAIADVAKEVDADLIVVGTRGHTVLGGLLVGSVTQRLLHITPCPVLAVPAEHDR